MKEQSPSEKSTVASRAAAEQSSSEGTKHAAGAALSLPAVQLYSQNAVVQRLLGGEEYQGRWEPGMTALGAAKESVATGWQGTKAAAGLGLEGAKGAASLGMQGAEGALELGDRAASKINDVGAKGISKVGYLAGAGIGNSIKYAGKGISLAGDVAEAGALASGRLGLSGMKESAKLGYEGIKGSASLAGQGIAASGRLAAAPAKWAAEGVAGTNSKLKQAGYIAAGALGTLVSAPAGLVGAIGSGALGATGMAGSIGLGAAGAAGSGLAGLTGVVGSGAVGLTGALTAGGLGAAGAIGSGALGLAGGTAIAGGSIAAAGTAKALGAAGALGAGTLGAAGAIGAGTLGAVGALGAGTLGLAGGAVAGVGGGLAMAGGGVSKLGSIVSNKIGDNANKGLLGIYEGQASHDKYGDKVAGQVPSEPGEFDPVSGQRINYGATTGGEGLGYSLLGAGGASTVGATITDMASKGNVIGDSIRDKGFVSPLSGGAEAFGGLGAAAGILGTGAALVDATRAGKTAMDKSGDTGTRVMAGAQAVSSTADAVKSSASAAFNIASLVDAKGAAAAGAQVAAGGASIAMGTIDMIRGGYGMFKAKERTGLLTGIRDSPDATPEVRNMAQEAIETQSRAKVTGGSQVAKGALAVAGGVLLAASMATPVGWMLLGVGAIVGLTAALLNWRSKKNQKEKVAIRELGLEQAIADHKVEVERIKNLPGHGIFTKKRKEAIAALGDPLKDKLKSLGFDSPGHFYSNYINATANKLYQEGVVNGIDPYTKIISSIGLKRDETSKPPTPTPEKIAKALSG